VVLIACLYRSSEYKAFHPVRGHAAYRVAECVESSAKSRNDLHCLELNLGSCNERYLPTFHRGVFSNSAVRASRHRAPWETRALYRLQSDWISSRHVDSCEERPTLGGSDSVLACLRVGVLATVGSWASPESERRHRWRCGRSDRCCCCCPPP
jgi:hypothetical protein